MATKYLCIYMMDNFKSFALSGRLVLCVPYCVYICSILQSQSVDLGKIMLMPFQKYDFCMCVVYNYNSYVCIQMKHSLACLQDLIPTLTSVITYMSSTSQFRK